MDDGAERPPAADLTSQSSDEALFRRFDDYPWAKDRQFMQGLAAAMGKLLPSADMARARSISVQARIWWFASRQNLTIDADAYASYLSSAAPHVLPPETALLARLEYIQRQMMGITTATNGAAVPSWQVHAPPANLAVKASDGAERPSHRGADEAPYPQHFRAIIEAVTTGKDVPGLKEIPDTVIRQDGITPIGKMQAPRKPWEVAHDGSGGSMSPPSPQALPQDITGQAENASIGSALPANILDQEFPPVLDMNSTSG